MWIEELQKLVSAAPGRGTVSVKQDDIEVCSSDETEDFVFPPEVVVFADTTDEVAAVMKFAHSKGIPVTPRGAGTGLSGGALPVRGGIVLSLAKMNRIVEIDRENFFVTVEPGVITQKLQEEVERVGLFYPPDPASRGSCTIGGNLAENSGGPRALKYGVTKDYVYGIEAVLPDGRIIHSGGKLLKNVTGYNLTQLLIGSEGTLAIITKMILKLIPLPKHKRTLIAPFPTLESAAQAVPALFLAGVSPCALEFMEKDVIQCAASHLGKTFPHQDAAAQLLMEIDGNDEDALDRDAERISEVVMEGGALDLFMAETTDKQAELWGIRRACGEAVKKKSVYRELDTVVPRAAFPALIRGVKEIAQKHGLAAFCYGHVGDGNLHVNVLKESLSQAEWEKRIPMCTKDVFELTVSLGGTLSGEHGIGWVQKDYMSIAFDPASLEIQRELKRAFDPKGVLNPDKLLPN